MATTILTQIPRFINDSAGLEKTLRLLQALVQIIAAYSLSAAAAKPWLIARAQFALGRRYLRILRFIDAFRLSLGSFRKKDGDGDGGGFLLRSLEVGKWSCLGMYLMLESFTILDAMGVYQTIWAAPVFREAMKFWFYSLSLSVVLSIVRIWRLYVEPTGLRSKAKVKGMGKVEGKLDGDGEKNDEEEAEKEIVEWRQKREGIMRKLVIDACDIVIPGSVTGWMKISSANVGMCSVVSTVLAGTEVWVRIQGQTE